MPLYYEEPPDGSLRQGEILRGIHEHRPLLIPAETRDQGPPQISTTRHPLVLVVTAWCDLAQDYRQRSAGIREHPNLLDYVLVCNLYEEKNIRTPPDRFKSNLWRRVRENRDQRYHHIPPASTHKEQLPDLYLDFKRLFSVPLGGLYETFRSGDVGRVALLPPLYREEVIQRLYSFHSRVSLPD